jgi:hypothetical protein
MPEAWGPIGHIYPIVAVLIAGIGGARCLVLSLV